MAKKSTVIKLKPQITQLNWKGNTIKQVKYSGKFSTKDVQKLADTVKDNLNPNQELLVTLNYGPQIGPRSSKWATSNSQHVELYNANDYNEYLIEMWKSVSNGWLPKDNYTEQDYKYIKENKEENKTLTAYFGFALSYGGKWFGGWRRDKQGNIEIESY